MKYSYSDVVVRNPFIDSVASIPDPIEVNEQHLSIIRTWFGSDVSLGDISKLRISVTWDLVFNLQGKSAVCPSYECPNGVIPSVKEGESLGVEIVTATVALNVHSTLFSFGWMGGMLG